MRFLIRLIGLLFGIGAKKETPHNSSDLTLAMLRIGSQELIENYTSYREQLWETGRGEDIEEVQILAAWVGKELQRSVGFPPTIN